MQRNGRPTPIKTKRPTLQELREACIMAHAECQCLNSLLGCYRKALDTIEQAIEEPESIPFGMNPLEKAKECFVSQPSLEQWVEQVREAPCYNEEYTREQEEEQSAQFQERLVGWRFNMHKFRMRIIERKADYAKIVEEYQRILQERDGTPTSQPMLEAGQGHAMLAQSPDVQSMEVD